MQDESGHVRKMAGMTKGGTSSVVGGKSLKGGKVAFGAYDGHAKDAGTRRFDVTKKSLNRSRKI